MKKRYILPVLFLALKLPAAPHPKKINLYSCYTPSHTEMKEKWFWASLMPFLNEYNVYVEKYPQECNSARFMEYNWKKTTSRKVDLIIRAVKENWGDLFLYSDIDIQFFEPTKDWLLDFMGDDDLVIQMSHKGGGTCTGFFMCRCNEKTLRMWQDVKKLMQTVRECSDQNSLYRCLVKNKNPYGIKWKNLPIQFFSLGCVGLMWNAGEEIDVPKDIKIHHANCTVGVKNKLAMLKYVRKKYSQLKQKNQKEQK